MAEIPDFRVQQQVPIAGLAELLASRPVKEAQIRAMDEERRLGRFNSLMNAVRLGSDLASAGIARSQVKQEMEAKRGLADILGRMNQSVTRATPAFGPVAESGQAPLFLERTTFGQTPEFESQLLSKAAMVAPEKFGEQIAKTAFPDMSGSEAPKSFQQILSHKVAQGEMTLEQAGQQFRRLFPNVREDPVTGEIVQVGFGGEVRPVNRTPSGKPQQITAPEQLDDPTIVNPIQRKRIETVLTQAADDVSADPVIRKLRETQNELKAVRELAESDNPAAVAILPLRVVRGIGREVGALSQSDVAAAGGSQELYRKAQRKASVWSTGKLPEGDVNDFIQLANIAEKAAGDEMQKEIARYVKRTKSRIPNVSEEMIKSTVGFEVESKNTIKDSLNPDVQKSVNTIKAGETRTLSDGTIIRARRK